MILKLLSVCRCTSTMTLSATVPSFPALALFSLLLHYSPSAVARSSFPPSSSVLSPTVPSLTDLAFVDPSSSAPYSTILSLSAVPHWSFLVCSFLVCSFLTCTSLPTLLLTPMFHLRCSFSTELSVIAPPFNNSPSIALACATLCPTILCFTAPSPLPCSLPILLSLALALSQRLE